MGADALKPLFYGMLRIRMVEEAIADLYPEQEMRCPVHVCIGQEAVAVGVCAALRADDYAMSAHRSHGHYLAKGGNLRAMLAELYGKATGCAGGKGGSMHMIDLAAGFIGATPIIGSTIAIAVGAALGSRMRGEARVTAVFFGEAATEEGTFHEAVNFAVLKRLPVLFVCENNLYSVYSPLEVRQPEGRTLTALAAGHGIESREGDGNDVQQVLAFSADAAVKALHGGGPTFLEFKTYRLREHCGPNDDDDLGYRRKEEVDTWKGRCPIARTRAELLRQGVPAANLDAMSAALRREIDDAVAFAKSSPYPERRLLMEHVAYARQLAGV